MALAQGVFLTYLDPDPTRYDLEWLDESGTVLFQAQAVLPTLVHAYADSLQPVLVTDEVDPWSGRHLLRAHAFNAFGEIEYEDTLLVTPDPMVEAYSGAVFSSAGDTLTALGITYLADVYPLQFRLHPVHYTARDVQRRATWDQPPSPAGSFTSAWSLAMGPDGRGALGYVVETDSVQTLRLHVLDATAGPAGEPREWIRLWPEVYGDLDLAVHDASVYALFLTNVPRGEGLGGAYLTALPLDSFATPVTEPVAVVPRLASLTGYPNPFNGAVRIDYTLPLGGAARLRIFDVLGREVAAPALPGTAGAGHLWWSAEGLSSGLYFARLESGATSVTTRLLLLR